MQRISKSNRKESMLPAEIWDRVSDILEEISDESGEEYLGVGYLLKYEGWGAICVAPLCVKLKGTQKEEEAYFQYAESLTDKIIENEWKKELRKRGYQFILGGYDRGNFTGKYRHYFKGK